MWVEDSAKEGGKMRVQDLIEALQGMDPDAEVRIASQPSWPFEHRCNDVVEVDLGQPDPEDAATAQDILDDPESAEEDRETARKMLERDETKPKIVYLAEGPQVGYLPGIVRSEIGW